MTKLKFMIDIQSSHSTEKKPTMMRFGINKKEALSRKRIVLFGNWHYKKLKNTFFFYYREQEKFIETKILV